MYTVNVDGFFIGSYQTAAEALQHLEDQRKYRGRGTKWVIEGPFQNDIYLLKLLLKFAYLCYLNLNQFHSILSKIMRAFFEGTMAPVGNVF